MKSDMYENKSYTEHFKRVSSALKILNKKSRNTKFMKIISVINDFSRKKNKDLNNLNCLDIGCSGGLITVNLSKYFHSVVGIDTDPKAIEMANKHHDEENLKFNIGSGLNIPYDDESFDAVICNHIYEHVPDYKKLFLEIYRVLRKGGFCYLSAGNKYVLIEGHYHLPFLSWLPKNLANLYLKITNKGDYYEEEHKSYFDITKSLKKFEINDYTIDLIKTPVKYNLTDMINPNGLIPKIPRFLYELFKPLLPTYIFIIRKPL